MRTSQTTAAISAALAKAQAEYPPLTRNREVQVYSKKTGSTYTFTYATLDHIFATFRPILAKHGLSVSAATQAIMRVAVPATADGLDKVSWERFVNEPTLVVRLNHSTGEWYEADLPLGGWQDDQELGGRLTYRTRYLVCLLLGICAEDDNDGHGRGDEVSPRDKAPQAKAKKAPAEPAEPIRQEGKSDPKVFLAGFQNAIQSASTPLQITDFFAQAGKVCESRGCTLAEIEKLRPFVMLQHARLAIGNEDFFAIVKLHGGNPTLPGYGLGSDALAQLSAAVKHRLEKGT